VFAWANAGQLLIGDGKVNRTDDDAIRFAEAVALREHLYGVFGPIANGDSPHVEALTFVTRRAAMATRSARWVSAGDSFQPQWPGNSIESICDRLADAALLLLRSPSVARVGSCAGCGWLFLDTSRANARRWCSMNVCGVRDKMRRYHQRQSNATSTL
jgi:predicted RNA-binding Zn ribbon-like protein